MQGNEACAAGAIAAGCRFFAGYPITPASEIASRAQIEGSLPTRVNIIDLPDLEISINLGGMIFELQSPEDGAAFSASAIGPSKPILFIWSSYNQGESYFVELGPDGETDPIYTSRQVTTTNLSWDGTLDDDSHISAGLYWWRVVVSKSLGNYTLIAYTQQFDLQANP